MIPTAPFLETLYPLLNPLRLAISSTKRASFVLVHKYAYRPLVCANIILLLLGPLAETRAEARVRARMDV